MSSGINVTFREVRVVCVHCGHDHEDGLEFWFEYGTGYAMCQGCGAELVVTDDE